MPTGPVPARWIPTRTPDGGSLVGNTYLSTFAACPREWFNIYLRPTVGPNGQLAYTGIAPIKRGRALLQGTLVHKALEAWYLSGSKDGADTGAYDIDVALAAIDDSATANQDSFESETILEQDRTLTRHMMRRYADSFGPDGLAPDFPNIQVVHDGDGLPLVEREFAVPLGGNYWFTCKVDLIVQDLGFFKIFEHKTAAPNWVGQRLSSLGLDSQFTGELCVLTDLFPDEPLHGVRVNVLPKVTGNTKFGGAVRETTTRTAGQLAQFAADAVGILKRIDESVEQFKAMLAAGTDIETAAAAVFPLHGTRNGRCYAFRGCPFQRLCQYPERAAITVGAFRPRTVAPVEVED